MAKHIATFLYDNKIQVYCPSPNANENPNSNPNSKWKSKFTDPAKQLANQAKKFSQKEYRMNKVLRSWPHNIVFTARQRCQISLVCFVFILFNTGRTVKSLLLLMSVLYSRTLKINSFICIIFIGI